MEIRASVKCINAASAYYDQAGVIMATDGNPPQSEVTVKWDTDQAVETVLIGDLVELGPN